MKVSPFDNIIVKKGQKRYGPLKLGKLVHQIKTSQLGFDFEVFHPDTKGWLKLSEHKTLSPVLVTQMRNAKNISNDKESNFSNWFISSGENRYGPFTLLQMLQYIQLKRLKPNHLVFHPNFNSWQPLNEIKLLDSKNVSALFEFNGLRNLFLKRSAPRVPYKNSILINESNRFYQTSAWSLSTRGLGVISTVKTPFVEGQKINIYLDPHQGNKGVMVPGCVQNQTRVGDQENLVLTFNNKVESLNPYFSNPGIELS